MLRRLFNKLTGRDKALRRAVVQARLDAIRERSREISNDHNRRVGVLPTFNPAIPVVFYDPYRPSFDPTPRPIEPEPFVGGGGLSGGAGASASWDTPVADQCAPSYDSSPSFDSSPSCDSSPSGGSE
jgi:hypothetical protein